MPACTVLCLREGVGKGGTVSLESNGDEVGLVIDYLNVFSLFADYEITCIQRGRGCHTPFKGIDDIGVGPVGHHTCDFCAATCHNTADCGGGGHGGGNSFASNGTVALPTEYAILHLALIIPDAATAERSILITIHCLKMTDIV